jgi:hypothetical protein
MTIVTRLKMMTSKGRSDILTDDRKLAMCGLRSTIEEVTRIETTTAEALRSIASEVKTTGTRNKGALREILTRSRTNRNKLTAITKKRQSLQQHLDTLETSELNQQVLSSVRQTSDVLRSMGLDQKLESVDELLLDMAENHEDVRSIQNGLSQQYGAEPDPNDLEDELALLMGEEEMDLELALKGAASRTPLLASRPLVANSMSHTQPAGPDPGLALEAIMETEDEQVAALPVSVSAQST